jgi:hypothetical protein
LPVLVDPQLSSARWLRALFRDRLMCFHLGITDFLSDFKRCVAAIIDNVGTDLDRIVDPPLAREFLGASGETQVVLAGEAVPIESDFHLFIATKHPNPRFSPEVCSLFALVNFATTTDGLTDLLWNALFEVECEDVDRKRVQLMEGSLENCQPLRDDEVHIITIIANTGRDVLEDDPAINTLQAAQRTSVVIEAVMAAAEKTEQQIQLFKEQFRSGLERTALLYRCVPDFRPVHPLEQVSRHWFALRSKRTHR